MRFKSPISKLIQAVTILETNCTASHAGSSENAAFMSQHSCQGRLLGDIAAFELSMPF